MSVGNLEEIIDDNHAIVSTSVGSEHYVSILSFVDKDQLEPGCSVLLNHKVGHCHHDHRAKTAGFRACQ
jgi:26S proteasome regulatory subunit T2